MLTPGEIRTFIANDKASQKKRMAEVGLRYYEGDHDIKRHRIFFINADGRLQEDQLRANIRIGHPFFTELVDQEVQYMLSGQEAFIRSDDPALQAELNSYFNENEDFVTELYEVLTGSTVKGFEYMYAYKKQDGRTAFECADSMGVVEVRAKETQDGCDYVIYWYVDRVDTENRAIKRIQVWDATQTWFYTQIDDGDILPDTEQPLNPRPHTLYSRGEDGLTYYDSYGVIPFFRMDNNRKQLSSLRLVKDLIDDYDLMNCGLSNNIEDTNEALYIVHGFQGDNLDELMQNIKAKKHIGVDEDGGVDIKTVDVPVQARRAKMEVDEQNIYRFGMGLNTYGLKDTAATTNIAIKAAYSLLDLKTNKLEIRLKHFLRKLLEVVLAEINEAHGTAYTQQDVYFYFERELPTNAMENAQIALAEAQTRQTEINTLLNLSMALDSDTILQLIAEQLDLDYHDLRERQPDEATISLAQARQTLDEDEEQAAAAEGGEAGE